MDPNSRLRIATRIHFALLRHYGEQIAVTALLQCDGDSREALWVCEASGDAELIGLSHQFKTATRAEARNAQSQAHVPAQPAGARAKAAAPQDVAWSQDTSGFGLSRPAELGDAMPSLPARWLTPARWLRGGSPR